MPSFPAGNMHVEVNMFTHVPKDSYLVLNGYTYFIYIINASFTGKKAGFEINNCLLVCG